MMNSNSYEIGINAENLVSDYMATLGYITLNRRYKTPYGEIDLIVKKDKMIIFVEVKARKDQFFDASYITKKQINRNNNAARFFLASYKYLEEFEVRFDLVVVVEGVIDLHLENAWYAE
jgi:putative endonuclease